MHIYHGFAFKKADVMCLFKRAGEILLSIVKSIIECVVLFSMIEMHNIFFWMRLSQINGFYQPYSTNHK
ncbi:hypothetical protein HA38_18340 [Pantoea allii]|nr:hypothetical protein HA38_18340 [Pantoea allii]PBK00816.1 hypothetical protein CMR03_07300 [Pantoea allii]